MSGQSAKVPSQDEQVSLTVTSDEQSSKVKVEQDMLANGALKFRVAPQQIKVLVAESYDPLYITGILRAIAQTAWRFFSNLGDHCNRRWSKSLKSSTVTEDTSPVGLNEETPNITAPSDVGRFSGPVLLVGQRQEVLCTSCRLCQTVCPTQCIDIAVDELSLVSGQPKPSRFKVHQLQCITCGWCVEACPSTALKMGFEGYSTRILSGETNLGVVDLLELATQGVS